MPELQEDESTCAIASCDNATPWDMASIILDDTWYCTPRCARTAITECGVHPDTVTVHDPQYSIKRDETDLMDEDEVDYTYDVETQGRALMAIDEAQDLGIDKHHVDYHEHDSALQFILDSEDGKASLIYDSSHGGEQWVDGEIEDAGLKEWTTVNTDDARYRVWNGREVLGVETGEVTKETDENSRKVGTFERAFVTSKLHE